MTSKIFIQAGEDRSPPAPRLPGGLLAGPLGTSPKKPSLVTNGRTEAQKEPCSGAHPPPVRRHTGSGPAQSRAPATDPQLPLLRPAQREDAPRQGPQPTHRQVVAWTAAFPELSGTSHSPSILRGLREASRASDFHPAKSCLGEGPRRLRASEQRRQDPHELSESAS